MKKLPGIETAATSASSVANSGRRNNQFFTMRQQEVTRHEKAAYNRKNSHYHSRN